MKTKTFFLASTLLFAVFALSATTDNKQLTTDEVVQCGVSEDAIRSYLQGAPHYHTTTWFSDIRGTCNSKVGIENCGTATVFVENGIIIWHTDAGGICQ